MREMRGEAPPRAPPEAACAPGSSSIKLLEIAIDPPLAERDPAFGGEIGRGAGALGDAIVQPHEGGPLPLEPPHPFWKRVAQSLDGLKQRKVHIAEPAAEHMRAAAPCEH